MIYQVMIHSAGLLMLVGVFSITYNLLVHKVTKVRKPLYALALPMGVVLFAIYLNFLVAQVWQAFLLPRAAAQVALVTAFFILGLLLNLVPYVDRKEYEQIVRELGEADGS